MSLDNKLLIELEDLETTAKSCIKVIEDAFTKLEIEANNWEVKRRGIVKAGVKDVMKILQAKEKVSHKMLYCHTPNNNTTQPKHCSVVELHMKMTLHTTPPPQKHNGSLLPSGVSD